MIDLKAIRDRAIDSHTDIFQLLKLVDLQTGELLATEWRCSEGSTRDWCSSCGGEQPSGSEPMGSYSTSGRIGHRDGCTRDAVLTAAGFPDQASRDAERLASTNR